jgi:hypothetical protein
MIFAARQGATGHGSAWQGSVGLGAVRPGLTSAKKPFHEQPNHCLPSLEDENSAGLTADEHKLVQADQFKVHYSRVQAHQRKVKLGAEKSVWHERARNATIGPP